MGLRYHTSLGTTSGWPRSGGHSGQ